MKTKFNPGTQKYEPELPSRKGRTRKVKIKWGWLLILIILIALLSWSLLYVGKPSEELITKCLPEQRNADVCFAVYQPVCGTVNIQCVTTPCDPVKETFSNSCKACSNSLVSEYVDGEC